MKSITLAGFVALLTGPVALGLQGSGADCNSNGILDVHEIASGRAFDTNGNSVPDACESTRPWPVIRALGINRGPTCGWWSTGPFNCWDIWVSRSTPSGTWLNGDLSPGGTVALHAQLTPGLNTLYLRYNQEGCISGIWGLGLWLHNSSEPQVSIAPGNPSLGYFGLLNSSVTGDTVQADGSVITRVSGWIVRALSYSRVSGSDLVGTESPSPDGYPDWVTTLRLDVTPCGQRTHASASLVPFSFAQPRSWTVESADQGSSEVLLTITARGWLGSSTRFLNVRMDGVPLGVVFGAGSGAGSCTSTPSTATIAIPTTLFDAAAADGQIEFLVEPSLNATSAGCEDAVLSLSLEYFRALVDCDGNGIDDECQTLYTSQPVDCNQNGVLDACDIAGGTSADVNGDGRPDECEIDCNGNSLPDAYEIAQGLVPDCNQNSVPDSCDIAAGGGSSDVDGNGVPDDCKADCNNNGLPDAYEIAQGLVSDCDNNAVPDSCQIASNGQLDCNSDGILDSCQGGPDGSDCDSNGTADVCDILGGAADENANGRLDLCELRYGDLNLDGQINGTDLAGLLAVWGLPNPPYGDLDGDGQVGGTDLAFLLARWGPVP